MRLPVLNAMQIGQATLGFSDCTHGSLTYHLVTDSGSALDGTIALTRLGANVSCAMQGDNGNPISDASLSGAWYDPNDGGQGLLFDVDPIGNNLFAAWYTFAQNGQNIGGGASQRWFTLQSGDSRARDHDDKRDSDLRQQWRGVRQSGPCANRASRRGEYRLSELYHDESELHVHERRKSGID